MESFEYSISHYDNKNFNMFEPGITQETDIEMLISAIRCETTDPIEKLCLDYECNYFSNPCIAMQSLPQLYGQNEANGGIGNIDTGSASGIGYDNGNGIGISCYDVMDLNLNVIWNQEEIDVKVFGDDDSYETVTTRNPDTQRKSTGGGVKVDRARTLISERKRRSGMKEKLYALRDLVPDITKMDKASIVGDAARYIHDLQAQARNLRSEIATIEATKNTEVSSENLSKTHLSNSLPILKKISKIEMFNVEQKGYYVKLVCNKGRSVAVALHKALESITSFEVQSSNLATVAACGFDINLPNLKLGLSAAFLSQGFEFNTFPSP